MFDNGSCTLWDVSRGDAAPAACYDIRLRLDVSHPVHGASH